MDTHTARPGMGDLALTAAFDLTDVGMPQEPDIEPKPARQATRRKPRPRYVHRLWRALRA